MRIIEVIPLVVVGLVMTGWAQVSSSASSSASSEGQVRVTIGTFIFEQGQKLALEIEREEPCPCMCDELLVSGFKVLDSQGNLVHVDEASSYPVPAGGWTGRWDLLRGAGEPIPEGDYTVLVETSLGEFWAELEVTAPGATPMGHSLAKASVCGISLAVYKLVEETENGGQVSLGVGEKLLVALPGNPTTGYEWEVEDEPPFLARIEGATYRPSSTLIGGGGVFYFRYEATGPGEGPLRFAYRRPWESGPPERTFAITANVH